MRKGIPQHIIAESSKVYRLDDFRTPRSSGVLAPEAFAWKDFIILAERSSSEWRTLQRIPIAEFWGSAEQAKVVIDALECALKRSWVEPNDAFDRLLVIPRNAATGFDINLHFERRRIRGWFGGVEQDFYCISDAFLWVRRALSRSYHLSITFSGKRPCEWLLAPVASDARTVETLVTGQPVLFRSWRSKSIVNRQNVLL